jgi:NTP pyrophosphatase (non-canonical NTP hydrolase)
MPGEDRFSFGSRLKSVEELIGFGSRPPISLGQWQEKFRAMYGQRNAELNLSPSDIWLHLMEEAGELAADFRKEDYKKLWRDLPDVFAWLCAFANRTELLLEEVVWHKFPNVCPYCLKPESCSCIAENRSIMEDDALQQYRRKPYPETLDGWEEMFERIYGNVNTIQSSKGIGFHFMEEVSEVARELRREHHAELKNELADVLAWLVAVYHRAQAHQSGKPTTLSACIWAIYPGKCDKCGSCPCECENKARRKRRGSQPVEVQDQSSLPE